MEFDVFCVLQMQSMPPNVAGGVVYPPAGPPSYPGTFSPAGSVEGSPMHGTVYMNQPGQAGGGPYQAMPVSATGELPVVKSETIETTMFVRSMLSASSGPYKCEFFILFKLLLQMVFLISHRSQHGECLHVSDRRYWWATRRTWSGSAS